ncbi:MAG: type VI secretion system baseplate subunit TssF [Planctomycetota bacterium]
MDPRLLRYYKDELEFAREMGAEFAAEYPKIAGRLGMSGTEVSDPYVERLLEGFAFLAARIQLKIDARFPHFTKALLERLFPNYLAPIPSLAMVQLQPNGSDPALAAGITLPRGTALKSLLGRGDQTMCEYRTAQPVTLWPLTVAEAQYVGSARDLATFRLPEVPAARAALRLRLSVLGKATLGQLPLDALTLFLQGPDDVPFRLFEQLLANTVAIVARPAGNAPAWQLRLDDGAIASVGFGDDEALLPPVPEAFQGHRLLQEYFAFPERFRCVEFRGLGPAVRRAGDQKELDLFVLFDRAVQRLENNVDATRFAPFTVPAVNLFEKRCDRIHLDPASPDYHVVPDRTRPLDFEVHSLIQVTGHGSDDREQRFRPLYGTDDFALPGVDQRYYTLDRRPRREPANPSGGGPRSSYVGSETFVTIVDAENPPFDPEISQLAVRALCSNRDLPLLMPLGQLHTDFTLDATAPVQGVRCIAGPTKPRPSLAHGEVAWRLVDQLALNYVTLVGGEDGRGAAALRELLALYGEVAERHVQKQVQGVRSVTCAPVVRRLPTPGPLAFGRGLRIELLCDESQFEGSSVFLLGSVLERFFARFVSLNSFTETVVSTVERGEIARWPPRIGNRQLL